MRSSFYEDYISSPEWKERRRRLVDVIGHKCQRCGSTVALQVHHTHYRTLGHERPSDVVVVCEQCHDQRHNGESDAWEFDQMATENGEFDWDFE